MSVRRQHRVAPRVIRPIIQFAAIFFGFCPLAFGAVAERTYAENSYTTPWLELIEPRRVSVGVGDHWQVTGDSEQIFFTNVRNQASVIERMVLGRGDEPLRVVTQEIPFQNRFDTQDPDWNPRLKVLTYVSFESNARGEICLKEFPKAAPQKEATGSDKNCFDHPGRVAQPLWGPANQIFFLSSALPWEQGGRDSIWVLDPESRLSRKVLEFGKIAAFTVHPLTGDILAVGWDSQSVEASMESSRPRFLYGQAKSRAAFLEGERGYEPLYSFEIQYPGFPATPRFTADGEELLFGYFVDDSNGDSRLDGDDKSIVLSLRYNEMRDAIVANGEKGTEGRKAFLPLLPKPLTSSSWNCLYPNIIADQIVMACAPLSQRVVSEDPKLNLYSLPRSGMVPPSWTREQKQSAREEARDPRDQILLSASLAYAFSADKSEVSAAQDIGAELMERALLHIESDEYGAALEVLRFWKQSMAGEVALSPDARLLIQVIRSLQILSSRQAASPKGNSSPEYERLKQARSGAVHPFGLELAKRMEEKLESLANQRPYRLSGGWNTLAKEPVQKQSSIFDRAFGYLGYRYTEYLRRENSISDSKAGELHAQLAEHLYDIDMNLSLSLTIRALSLAPREFSEGRMALQNESLAGLSQMQRNLKTLIDGAKAKGNDVDQQTQGSFRALNDQLEQVYRSKGLRHYSAYCSLIASELMNAQQYLLLGFHAANWLSRVPLRSFEYGEILSFYRGVYFERAYGEWNAGRSRAAADIFYSALRLTRDEEAHLGFILSSLDAGLSAEDLKIRYQANQEALGPQFSGEPILEALLLITDYMAHADRLSDDDHRHKSPLLKKAFAALEKNQEMVPFVRNLLRGFVEHELFRVSLLEGYSRSQEESLQDAIKYYSLALQDSSSSGRIRATLLASRGQLEFLAGNFGASMADLERAMEALPPHASERSLIALLASRAAGRSGRSDQAVVWLKESIANVKGQSNKTTESSSIKPAVMVWSPTISVDEDLLNRELAYHLAETGEFEASCRLYAQWIPEDLNLGAGIKKKTLSLEELGRAEHGAWACFRAGNQRMQTDSRLWFQRILHVAGELPQRTQKGQSRRNSHLDSHPAHLMARSSGFLAQLASSDEERIGFLKTRIGALTVLKEAGLRLALSERELIVMTLKSCVQFLSLQAKVFPKGGEGTDCVLQHLGELSADGGLRPSLNEIESLRIPMMLTVLSPGLWSPQEKAFLESQLLGYLDRDLSNPSSLSVNSWGEVLKVQFIQLHMLGLLLKTSSPGMTETDRQWIQAPQSWLDEAIKRLGLASADQSFLLQESRESLINWGEHLLRSVSRKAASGSDSEQS